MTRIQESVLTWVIIIILLLIIFSCKTRREVVRETVHDHDTVMVQKTDTFVEVKVKEVRDTVKQVEKHVITLNNVGDTIKEVHHYHDIMRTVIVDSTQRYQAKVDSLQKLVNHLRDTSKVVKKGIVMPWWMGVASPLIIVLGIFLFYIVRYIASKRWHTT